MSNMPAEVEAVFATFPSTARDKLNRIRSMIFHAAVDTKVGEITECLKWGQPSYLTAKNIGSTVRLGWSEITPDRVSVYFICNTNLVERFRDLYADQIQFNGNREIYFDLSDAIQETALTHCLSMALTYHRDKT